MWPQTSNYLPLKKGSPEPLCHNGFSCWGSSRFGPNVERMASDPYRTRERGHHAPNHTLPAQPVGSHPAGDRPPDACRASWTACLTTRCSSNPTGHPSTRSWGGPRSPSRPADDVLEGPLPPGYEPLCREVGDSIAWMRFCRSAFGSSVPHPSTLMKITTRCGEDTIKALNDALVKKAADAKVLKRDKARADTTVCGSKRGLPDRFLAFWPSPSPASPA